MSPYGDLRSFTAGLATAGGGRWICPLKLLRPCGILAGAATRLSFSGGLRVNGRLSLFAGRLKDRSDEYHRLLADLCVLPEDLRRVIEIYGKARERYLRRERDEAINVFKQALEIRPNDGPSLMFIKKIESLKKNPPPAD